jgi:hypothetical protein
MSRSPLPLPLPVSLAAALVALAPATAAQAGSIALDKPCYAPGEPMVATGSAFAAGSSLTLGGDHVFPPVTADPSGNFQVGLTAPDTAKTGARPSDVVTQTLTATDPDDPAQATQTQYQVVPFTVDRGKSRNPRSKRTWYFSGFPAGSTVYGHFRLKGRTMSNYRFGKAAGPCGLLHARARGIPVRALKPGTWTLQLDGNKHFKKSALPALVLRISVFLRPR